MRWCGRSLTFRRVRRNGQTATFCRLSATWNQIRFGGGPDELICTIHKKRAIKNGWASESHFYRDSGGEERG